MSPNPIRPTAPDSDQFCPFLGLRLGLTRSGSDCLDLERRAELDVSRDFVG